MKSRQGANNTYFGNIKEGFVTLLKGLRITWNHIVWSFSRQRLQPISVSDQNYFTRKTGTVTLQYPFETYPVPDNGRYRLHNDIDDCILCDKCAKVCPVNCISIESIKAGGEIAKASNGASIRMYAAKFDINMAQCCYCGLCTVVCPTECLTMTKVYDFSEYEIDNMTYSFAKMSREEVEQKEKEYQQRQEEKAKQKDTGKEQKSGSGAAATKKVSKPVMKKPSSGSGSSASSGTGKTVKKPARKKSKGDADSASDGNSSEQNSGEDQENKET